MQQFNKISLYSNVIKNLLATTYLPLVRSVRAGDYMCKDRLYIFRCEFVMCTKSGFVGSSGFDKTFTKNVDGSMAVDVSNKSLNIEPGAKANLANWTTLQEFHFGDRDGKLSTNYVSNCEGYDYRTHERLGQYLRNLRDMYGLNLLPLYNCFSNQPLENHIIDNKRVKHTSAYANTKVYKVPVKFNQDYTICIENLGRTTIAPAFIRNNNLVKQNNTQYGNGIDITNQYISLHVHDNVSNYVNTSFGKPFKVRFDNYPHVKNVQVLENTEIDAVEILDSAFVSGTTQLPVDTVIAESIKLLDSNGVQVDNDNNNEDHEEHYATFDNRTRTVTQTSFKPGKSAANVAKISYTYVNCVSNNVSYEITDEVVSQFAAVENTLYMLIQVPKVFNQNIVILEGDYTSLESQKIVDALVVNTLPDFLYDKYYIHDLNLMTSTTTDIRPFSPVLVEFLLWNAICTLDTINNDLDRLALDLINEYIPHTDDFDNGSYPNVWVSRYRQIISDFITYKSKNIVQDNLGYATRDMEAYLHQNKVYYDPND